METTRHDGNAYSPVHRALRGAHQRTQALRIQPCPPRKQPRLTGKRLVRSSIGLGGLELPDPRSDEWRRAREEREPHGFRRARRQAVQCIHVGEENQQVGPE